MKLTAASWCSQRLWMMHRQLVFSSPEGKETTPPFGRWAWGFESSDHDYMAYHWERKGFLVDMVNQGTWAKASVLSSVSHVHHIGSPRDNHFLTSLWNCSTHFSHLGPRKKTLCSLFAEREQWYLPVLPGCSYADRDWSVEAVWGLHKARNPPTSPELPRSHQTAQFFFSNYKNKK